MKIGNLEIKNNVFLAPMAGITDMAFRKICKEYGAGLVYTEMVSSKGMHYKDDKTNLLTAVADEERPAAVQIFGSDPDIMADAAEKIAEFSIDGKHPVAFIPLARISRSAVNFFRNQNSAAGCQNLYGIGEINIFFVHEKAENISAFAAAETVVTLPRDVNMKRRGLFLMKRTQPLET